MAELMSPVGASSSAAAAPKVIGSRRLYPVRTSAALCLVAQQQLQQQQQPSTISPQRYRVDLGPGGFRSQSRRWVDGNRNSRENVMRRSLEELLGQPFVKIRPAFLLNPTTKRRLELDAYCEPLRLAVEFDGEQVSGTRRSSHIMHALRKPLHPHACVTRFFWIDLIISRSPSLCLSPSLSLSLSLCALSTTPSPMRSILRVRTLRSNGTVTASKGHSAPSTM